ncbi:Maf family protein [Marinomonas pollencensis]|uniref:7-methyl-GTP pyrophosphatase n=1 Tax=Marinomonas pollencensis TaxID=491954 RepID=A0A3E0DRQ7_9GAMM|nr:nucleoside triphosphate pyrophosphatase [Marinomonas pollencensis]REG85791.1 MAF protein [Marinomonas pollencensis]
MTKKLILGSSSPYRRSLLERLNLTFECHSPDIDETQHKYETAAQLVKSLSISKAQKVKADRQAPNELIIASDQVAVLDQEILGKPHTKEKAIEQLSRFSERKVTFLTGLCVLDSSNNEYQYALSEYQVFFRQLAQSEIERYIYLESPLNCAGSFKCEGLGVTLFSKMEGDDPNSLIGLPLINLCNMLRQYGVNPLL